MPEGKVVTSAAAGTLAVPDDVVPRSLEEVPPLNRSPLRLMVRLLRTTVFTLLTVLIANSAAAQEKPSRIEIGRRGKAATVLVLVGDRSGSAFCIHPAGFYVTNEHIVRGAVDHPVRLVLDSTLNSQRVVEARVVRTDNARDLALLKADGVTDAAVLPIASSDEVSELAEVIAFGFPFGTALSVRNEEYPAISVNVCTVSALRNKKGELDRIELNGAVNPGQSGGPVLDSSGNVVGVIASGIRGSGISQSIPSLHLMRFLELPDVQLLVPKFDTPAAAAKPAIFRARVSTLLPGETHYDVELIVTRGEPTTNVQMEFKDGVYEATLVPVPAPNGPNILDLTARYSNGTVIVSPVTDRELSTEGQVLLLSDVLRIRPRAPNFERADGTSVNGLLKGLEEVGIRIGESHVTLNLTNAELLEIARPSEPTHFEMTVAVRAGDRELSRTSEKVSLNPVHQIPPDTGSVVVEAVRPPNLNSDRVVTKLPAAIGDVALGGNGRYLILHLPALRKLAIFDVSDASISGYIPVDDDSVRFAAGQEKLVVGLPDKGVLQRWDLKTRERELSVQAGVGKIKHVVMGHASAGPVLVHMINTSGTHAVKTEFLDLKTFRSLEMQGTNEVRGGDVEAEGYVRASADGLTFAFWRINVSPAGISTLVIRGNQLRRSYMHDTSGHLIPSPDGRVIYTGRGRYTPECKALDEDTNINFMLPSVHGDYYLHVGKDDKDKSTVSVHRAGDKRPLARPDVFAGLPGPTPWGREELGLDHRLFLIPEARVIVTLPNSNDEVVLYKFDIDDVIEKSGVDYLFVTSYPPATAQPGTEFTYRVTARAKKGGVTYKLDDGPPGMKIDADGLVTWTVPAQPEGTEASVIIAVRDGAGQETLHTFTLKLE
jgi:hypothetical protein